MRVRLFPETFLAIQMCDPIIPERKIQVTGRADWALGYSKNGKEGAWLVTIGAKQRSEFSRGEAQLIAYLAILRETCLRAKKTNIVSQGFYSDGCQFVFIASLQMEALNDL